MSPQEFQLLMGRLQNQDDSLARIEQTTKNINGRVRQNEKDIAYAKGLGYAGMMFTSAAWGIWTWWSGK
jgi:hypothetical protein